MKQQTGEILSIGTILRSPYWLDHVLIEAVTLDDQTRLISLLLKPQNMDSIATDAEAVHLDPTKGDPIHLCLATKATCIDPVGEISPFL
jgi:hypothetical protein